LSKVCKCKEENAEWYDEVCRTCRGTIPAPNVRIFVKQTEVETSNQNAHYKELRNLGVVVTMSVVSLRELVRKKWYPSHSQLVRSGEAEPYKSGGLKWNKKRAILEGFLFGSLGSRIVYGALSNNGKGIPDPDKYGPVYIKLKNDVIERRVTFTKRDSATYVSVVNDEKADCNLPNVDKAIWRNVRFLAAKKMKDNHIDVDKVDDELISKNNFIEAQVFNHLTPDDVESYKVEPAFVDVDVERMCQSLFSGR